MDKKRVSEDTANNISLAKEILRDYKIYNQILQILLIISILSNIAIAIILK